MLCFNEVAEVPRVGDELLFFGGDKYIPARVTRVVWQGRPRGYISVDLPVATVSVRVGRRKP